MKKIMSVLALGLCVSAVAKSDTPPEYNLVCKSTYDVQTADDSMSVKGPTLTSPIVAALASGTKEKTRWGVGYSAAYTGQTGKVTISITTERGTSAKTIALISSEMDAQLSMSLDSPSSSKDQTTLNVVCTMVKK